MTTRRGTDEIEALPMIAQHTDDNNADVNVSDRLVIEVEGNSHGCGHITFVGRMLVNNSDTVIQTNFSRDDVMQQQDNDSAPVDPFDPNYVVVSKICAKTKTWFLTEFKHLKTMEEFRRNGAAEKMLRHIISITRTPIICCTVKANNDPMISLLRKLDFVSCTAFTNNQTGNEIMLWIKNLTEAGVQQ